MVAIQEIKRKTQKLKNTPKILVAKNETWLCQTFDTRVVAKFKSQVFFLI